MTWTVAVALIVTVSAVMYLAGAYRHGSKQFRDAIKEGVADAVIKAAVWGLIAAIIGGGVWLLRGYGICGA